MQFVTIQLTEIKCLRKVANDCIQTQVSQGTAQRHDHYAEEKCLLQYI